MILPQSTQVNPPEPPPSDPARIEAAREALRVRVEMRRRCDLDDEIVVIEALNAGLTYSEIWAILAGDA